MIWYFYPVFIIRNAYYFHLDAIATQCNPLEAGTTSKLSFGWKFVNLMSDFDLRRYGTCSKRLSIFTSKEIYVCHVYWHSSGIKNLPDFYSLIMKFNYIWLKIAADSGLPVFPMPSSYVEAEEEKSVRTPVPLGQDQNRKTKKSKTSCLFPLE